MTDQDNQNKNTNTQLHKPTSQKQQKQSTLRANSVSVTDQDMDMDMQEGGGLIQRRQRTKHEKGGHEKNDVEHGKVFYPPPVRIPCLLGEQEPVHSPPYRRRTLGLKLRTRNTRGKLQPFQGVARGWPRTPKVEKK